MLKFKIENITQAGVKDINYSYHKTTKKGFMGLTSNKHEEVKKGFSGSFSAKGASLSYGKDKLESKTDIKNQTASQIVAKGDININTSDKVRAKSVDIYAKENVNISGDNGVKITTANDSYDNKTKQSSTRISTSIGLNSSITNTFNNIKNVKKLTDFKGDSYAIVNVVESIGTRRLNPGSEVRIPYDKFEPKKSDKK